MHLNEGHAGSPLEIAVRTTGLLDASLLPRVEKRVRAALQRYAAHIRAVRVHLKDINGPRGGVDKECTIAVRLAVPPRLLVIEDVDSNAAAAADRAADRAACSVVRAVQARQHWRLQPQG